MKEGGGCAIPAYEGQRLATIVTTAARHAGATTDDFSRVARSSRTKNWVRISGRTQDIRPLTPREMCRALNLPATYADNANTNETEKRKFLGSAFGVGSIAHVFRCLLPLAH